METSYVSTILLLRFDLNWNEKHLYSSKFCMKHALDVIVKGIKIFTFMDKQEMSGFAGKHLIAWALMSLVGFFAGTCTSRAQSWLGFQLKTPEPRTYWVEPATGMLGPALGAPATVLDVRYSKS